MTATQERGITTINWNFEGDSTAFSQAAAQEEKGVVLQSMSLEEEVKEITRVLSQPATIVGGMMLGVSAIYEFAPDVMHKVFQAMTLYPTESKLIALANMAIAGLAFLALRTSPGKMAGWIAFTAIAVTLIVIMEWTMLVS
ncbi:MAG: hypothetical protein C0507_24220 [Cyanobacteria bacterium PR.3.49]|nr:hypothetical protein [Cyanobacteria bacterium PR.3.49]